MIFKKHVFVGHLAQDFDFAGDVGHGVADAFALAVFAGAWRLLRFRSLASGGAGTGF